MSDNCRGKKKSGESCTRPASPGLNGYCPWHYQPDDGESKKKPDKPDKPKGGGSGGVTLGLTIINTLKNVWDFIKDNLPDILALTASQSKVFAAMSGAKNNAEKGDLLTQLLTSLTPAQVLQLVSAFAAQAQRSKSAQPQWLQVLSLLLSTVSTATKKSKRRADA